MSEEITTDAELDALPVGAIIRDAWGDPMVKEGGDPRYYQWHYGENALADVRLPAIVLWLPEGGAARTNWPGGCRVNVREVHDAMIRRVEAAISSAGVSRSAVEFDWPECHRKGCQGRHGDVDSAFTTMKIQAMRAVRSELMFETVTRPDIAEPEDSREQVAVYALATLLNRYNVHDAGTFVKAAQLMVDAYPALADVLGEA